MKKRSLVLACCLLGACAAPAIKPSESHIQAEAEKPTSAPSPVTQSVVLPPPKPAAKLETYSVVVTGVPVQELLFALARDAKLNVDIHSGIQGTVTLNAINQTLPQILSRIAKQVDMRYEVDGPNLVVMPDAPFLRNYTIDYVNMAREAKGTVAIATRVATTGTGAGGSAGGDAGGAGNQSSTGVTNTAKNHFWDTLVQNIKDILRETDKILPEGSSETVVQQADVQSTTGTGTPATAPRSASGIVVSSAPATVQTAGSTVIKRTTFREAASVIANPETGILSIRATSRQHEKLQEFLDQVLASAKRQVLIEATIVEVLLNDNYQAGIDWSRIATSGTGFSITQAVIGPNLGAPPVFTLNYNNPDSRIGGDLSGTVKLLSTFGNTRVLSSPKIMVLNNQTALLKVVDENVYFTIELKITEGTSNNPPRRDFISTIHTVPVGLVMSVTPQISEGGDVSLNVRPTVSRIVSEKTDPAPRLAGSNFDNKIPEIQVREMESVLRVASGQIVVMGGLMQDSLAQEREGVPGLSRLPAIGDLFSFRNDKTKKTELVIFLRPLVVKDPSIDGDLRNWRAYLPSDKFFQPSPEVKPLSNVGTSQP